MLYNWALWTLLLHLPEACSAYGNCLAAIVSGQCHILVDAAFAEDVAAAPAVGLKWGFIS